MSRTTDLETRMKTYENVPKNKLMRRCPVAIRLDGCHFKSFTKGFDKPFDNVFMKSMQETMKYLCENVQGCVMGYTQSDEITLILVDYEHLNSEAWFDDEVEKICSVRNNRPAIMPDGRRTYYMYDKNKRANAWIIDHHIPVFTGAGRLYINALVYTESED